MKKRILSILLLCCMVLTLLPTTAFAADELPDVKLSIPTTFDKTVYLTNQKKELKITDSKTYLIKGSADPNWYFQYRIKIDGGRKKITPHIFLDGVRLQAPKDGPAIELYGGASACLYFIGNDSELIGAENFAALQKNKTDGHLRVLVQTGTKLTCEGGRYGAGIGGSKVGIKKFSQGHGMNLHFGSLATNIYGGEILAISGVYGAGIGGGQGGVGEWIYVYSGKLTVRSVSEGAGIGGGQGGPGRFIYIKGGTVNAGSESGGAGIGSGDQDGQNKSEDAHHIEISGGTVEAWSNYAGAGIGGGRDGSGYDISITGGVVRAQGYYGAGIGGGMNGNSGNILIKDTTLTALALPLYPSSDYTELSASAVGRGSNLLYYMAVMQDQEFAMTIEENIKIGASDGKSVQLSATGWQWRRNQKPYKKYWSTTTELLIPNENGRVDLQRLSLPYAYNYGRVISELELRCEESTCSHEFGWAIRDDCHIWACMKCGARDPAAEMSKQNGKHIPGDWSNQKQLCTVCDHVLERDTKAPVMETLTDGESYTVEDTLDGKPGAYTFTVIDPAASGETSSGVKSVTINGVEQDGPTYRLPAPDGGNNDAGAEYTVVATDNAGNETTATVRTYRRHHEHSYGDWSKDGTSHWHECTDTDCPNREESITDKAAHVYTDDADTTCDVCGYERTVTPPAHEHSYGDWSKDGTSHWHECADADCPNREESIKDKAAHVYTDDTDTTCDVCGYERTVTPPAPTEFIVTFDGNGGTGSMEPVTVEEGSRYVLPACGFTAPDGQEFKAWEIGGVEYNAGDGYVVLGNTEIKALWKDSTVIPTTFTITFNANGGTGSMEPVTVEEGSRYPLPACGFIPPVNMQFSGWALSADGSVIADGAIMVTSNITLYAIWEPVPVNEFVIFFDGNGGTPAVSSMTTIGHRLAFLPGAFRSGSYRFDGWYTERNGGELITTSTVFAANTIVYAHWTYTGGSGGSGGYVPGYYIIRATAGAGGSITPSGDVSVRAGANQTFTITPNRGYAVSDVKIDGRSIGAVRSYTFENISASHTIEVQFRVRSSFVDVPSGSYYEDAVDWAVANGITTGTDAAHFSPDGICTRAQAVTFLWRAAGRPAPESRAMPFTDVPADSYYYDAVLWAVENGITKGTSSTTFSPDDTCTRAQIVTFLWRSEQSPAAGSSNPFTDVSADAYYADAVLWAVKEAITTGTTRTTFSPDAECTRAQIVTFLWRCKK